MNQNVRTGSIAYTYLVARISGGKNSRRAAASLATERTGSYLGGHKNRIGRRLRAAENFEVTEILLDVNDPKSAFYGYSFNATAHISRRVQPQNLSEGAARRKKRQQNG